jgi:hypothetical protein
MPCRCFFSPLMFPLATLLSPKERRNGGKTWLVTTLYAKFITLNTKLTPEFPSSNMVVL